jgi:hypothetical protein
MYLVPVILRSKLSLLVSDVIAPLANRVSLKNCTIPQSPDSGGFPTGCIIFCIPSAQVLDDRKLHHGLTSIIIALTFSLHSPIPSAMYSSSGACPTYDA